MTEQKTPSTRILPEQSALLIDGSALYFGQRAFAPDKNMDYEQLLQALKKEKSNPNAIFHPAYFFTSSDQTNEKQAKFHQHIASLGLNVVEIAPHEAVVNNPLLSEQAGRVTRFDAMLAYSLRRLAVGAQ